MILLNLTNKIVKEVDILARLCYDMTFTLLDKGFMIDNITISNSKLLKYIVLWKRYFFLIFYVSGKKLSEASLYFDGVLFMQFT